MGGCLWSSWRGDSVWVDGARTVVREPSGGRVDVVRESVTGLEWNGMEWRDLCLLPLLMHSAVNAGV